MARTTRHDLSHALTRFALASGIASDRFGGSLEFSFSPDGVRLIERVGTSGERDISPRMPAREMVRALDLAAELFRMASSRAEVVDIAKLEVPPVCDTCGSYLTISDTGSTCRTCRA